MGYNDYAPEALVKLGKLCDKKLPGCTFSGVKGDSNHYYGYHRGRNVLPKSDYSVKLSLDKQGPAGAASALDLSFTAKQMKVMTARLKKSALDKNDPRLECVREFYGTINGRSVFGLMKNGLNTAWYSSSADSSHLTHIHISVFRKFSSNYNAIKGIYDVLAGLPYKKTAVAATPQEEFTVGEIVKALTAKIPFGAGGAGARLAKAGWNPVSIKTELDYIWENTRATNSRVAKLEEKVDNLTALLEKALKELGA